VKVLTASGVSKAFAGARALDRVDFDVRRGEVHALVGENGAGKSTLIRILSGATRADAGQITLDGAAFVAGDPLAVRNAGISTVYQEFTLVRELTVAENIFLGREAGRFLLNRSAMEAAARSHLDALGFRFPATAPVGDLSVAHQQIVEIARALAIDAKVLILDEPTATLSPADVERLFIGLRALAGRGLGIVYTSHRLDEIFAIADRVTVLRDGRRVLSADANALDRAALIRAMVGRDIEEEFPSRTAIAKSEGRPAAPVLEVRSLAAPPRFFNVSFSVQPGEIVALAGLVGAGRTSAALAIVGALRAHGEVRLNGVGVRFGSPAEAIRAGVVYVTEDRKARGVFPLMSTAANITITSLSAFSRAGLVSRARERAAAADAARRFDVRAAHLDQPAATLSGGNQQKALLARFLTKPRGVAILDEPTRGIDVGSRAEIYGLIARLAEAGAGILMISSDLTEVLGMADRIVVMRDGRTTGELTRAEATSDRVMALAS
jgi:ribose transport system ATP-binding protein